MSIIISDINNTERSSANKLQEGTINLKNGDIIRATIIRKLPEEGLLLSVNGKQINVQNAGLDLPEGSRHLFQISIIGSKIELKLIEAPVTRTEHPVMAISSNTPKETLTNILSELKNALDQTGLSRTTGQAARNLRQILPLIIYANTKNNDAIWVQENIMASGLFWESKVAGLLLSDQKNNPIKKILKDDLKGILLSLQKRISAEGSDSNDVLAVKIKKALDLIEGNQQLNLSVLEERLGWLFFIPGFEEDGFMGAEIFSKKRNEKGSLFFSVYLEFTRLGRVQANVEMTDSGTSVRILVDDQEKARIVNDNLYLLEKDLNALDVKNITISCDVRKGEETEESAMTDLKRRTRTVRIAV